ncbi:MAG TPA: ABC transporter substrate-binding protein [Trueperaceae bacterium]
MKLASRSLALMLAIALAFSALAQDSYQPEEFDGFPYDDQPNAVIPNDVIVVMGSDDFDPSTPAGAYLQEVARVYEQMHPNIDVQLNYGSWGDLWNKVGVMLGNRQGPDLVVGPRDYLMATGRGGGQWEDIVTVPEDQFLRPMALEALGATLREASRFPGRDGYMVWPWTVYIDGTMVVNGDMIREAGMDPLEIQRNGWTMEQFMDVAAQVSDDDSVAAFFGPMGGHNGERIFLTGLLSHRIPYRLQAHGGGQPTFIDIETGETHFDAEGFTRGCEAIRTFIDEGWVPENTVGIAFEESRDAFITGQTAFSFDGPDLINLVEERNRQIENGEVQGDPVEAFVVPRPHFGGGDEWQPVPITALSYGYYSFKQEPYKGDAHTRNVFDFARFLTDPVFQVRQAADNNIPPDPRVYLGEQSWFPGILGSGPNAQYVQSLREVWQPSMKIYISMATTPEWQAAIRDFNTEVYTPTKEEVFLGRISCDEAVSQIQTGLERVAQEVPQGERLTEEAPAIAEDMAAFAREIGQPE